MTGHILTAILTFMVGVFHYPTAILRRCTALNSQSCTIPNILQTYEGNMA